MHEELRRRKVELEEELKIIIQRKWKLEKELALADKDLADKQKEINNILNKMDEASLLKKQQKAERAEISRKEKEKKEQDLLAVLSSKSFYNSIRKYMKEPHWRKLTKAIQSDEFFRFILKNSYANRVIRAYENDTELNPAIMERMVSKLGSLIK